MTPPNKIVAVVGVADGEVGVRRVATAEKSSFLNKISPDVSRACAAPDLSMLMVGTTRALAVYICGPPPRTRPRLDK